jgi:SAM-dependent methyltransferase
MNKFQYQGEELDVFARAIHWKEYFKSIITPFIGQRVLEVGAGRGATTAALCDSECQCWLCSEPDENLRGQIDRSISQGEIPSCCQTTDAFLLDLDPALKFNTILYIDVLEHIEEDAKELQLASQHLLPGGFLVILSPAHPWLFSEFDASIGHFRRYERASLSSLTPQGCTIEQVRYLDSVGVLTSLVNRIFLKQAVPTAKQIDFWDSVLIPMARIIDPLTGFSLGRSIVAIWRKDANEKIPG